MPEMELVSPAFDGLYPWAWGAVRSYMLAPDDPDKRAVLKVNEATHMMEQIQTVAALPQADELAGACHQLAADAVLSFVQEKIFTPNGGWRSARKIGGLTELENLPIREWRTVAFAFGLMRAITTHHSNVRGGASLKKAYHAVDKHKVEYQLIANERHFKEAWKKYRSVAHLCTALFEPVLLNSNLAGEEQLLFFLSIARDHQGFITSFQSQGRDGRLVPENEVWLIPDGLVLPQPPEIVMPLPTDILITVESYEAPH